VNTSCRKFVFCTCRKEPQAFDVDILFDYKILFYSLILAVRSRNMSASQPASTVQMGRMKKKPKEPSVDLLYVLCGIALALFLVAIGSFFFG